MIWMGCMMREYGEVGSNFLRMVDASAGISLDFYKDVVSKYIYIVTYNAYLDS